MNWLLSFLRKIKDKVEDHFAGIIAAAFIGALSLAGIFFWEWVITKHSVEFYGGVWLLLCLMVLFLLIHFVCIMFDRVRRIKDSADIRNILSEYWEDTKKEKPDEMDFKLSFPLIDRIKGLKKGSSKKYLRDVVTKDGKWGVVREGPDTLLVKRNESRQKEIMTSILQKI